MLNPSVVCLNSNYREIYNRDPASWPSHQTFRYSGSTSTTSLRPHIVRMHRDLYLRIYKAKGWTILPGLASQVQSQAAKEASASRDTRPHGRVEFSGQKFHQHLLNFIIADDQVRDTCMLSCPLYSCKRQSLNIVECPEFRQLLLLLRSDLKDSDIPRRTKLRELLLQAWKDYFQVLHSSFVACLPPLLCSLFSFYLIQAAVGHISFTMDLWTDQLRRPYLAMTAHWIAEVEDSTLQLKSALIAFHRMRENHTGKKLAKTVVHLLDRAGVTVKVRHLRSYSD